MSYIYIHCTAHMQYWQIIQNCFCWNVEENNQPVQSLWSKEVEVIYVDEPLQLTKKNKKAMVSDASGDGVDEWDTTFW